MLFKKPLADYLVEYAADHANIGTRLTHMIGIPMIVASVPMLPFNPLLSGGLFVGGWALQFVGHYMFEKNDPKFLDDPANLLIGVLWSIIEWARVFGFEAPRSDARLIVIRRYLIELGGQEHELAVEAIADGRFRVTRDGKTTIWDAHKIGAAWSLLPEGGGPAREVDLDPSGPGTFSLTCGELVGVPTRVSDKLHRAAEKAAAAKPAGPAQVKSPMPGKIVRALVKVGETVTTGQPVVVVEAMKMENELKSPRDGKIVEVRGSEGQAIEAGQTLVVLE